MTRRVKPVSADRALFELLDRFEAFLKRLDGLCNELEELADKLPNAVESTVCMSVAQRLPTLIRQAHNFEDQSFYPVLLAGPQSSQELSAAYERLRHEHWRDEDLAQDLHDALCSYVQAKPRPHVDGLAWMLRSMFEALRRHIAFERDYIMPIARQTAIAGHRS